MESRDCMKSHVELSKPDQKFKNNVSQNHKKFQRSTPNINEVMFNLRFPIVKSQGKSLLVCHNEPTWGGMMPRGYALGVVFQVEYLVMSLLTANGDPWNGVQPCATEPQTGTAHSSSIIYILDYTRRAWWPRRGRPNAQRTSVTSPVTYYQKRLKLPLPTHESILAIPQ